MALAALLAAGCAGCGRIGFAEDGVGPPPEVDAVDLPSEVDAVDLPPEVPRAGMVGYWAFDEGAGSTSADLSGNHRDGILVGMEPEDWVAGIRGTALDFADDDYFRYGCAGTGCPTESHAVSFWFNADSLGGALVSYFGGEAYNSGRHKTIAFSGSFLHCGPSALRFGAPMAMFSPGRWYHVAVNYQDTSSISVFVDGVDVTVPTDDYWNSGAFSVGRRVDDYSGMQYDGRIDELVIYDRVLTRDEIASLYSIGS